MFAGPADGNGVEGIGLFGEEDLLHGLAVFGLLADLVHEVILHPVFAVFLRSAFALGPLGGEAGGAGAVDGLAVDLEPVADFEEEIAAAAHEIDEHIDEFAGRLVVVDAFGVIEAVGEDHAAALIPKLRAVFEARGAFGGPVTAGFVAAVFGSTVVDHDLVLRGGFVEEPREEFFALQIFRGPIPLAVGEDDRGRVTGNDVLELRRHMLGDVALAVLQPERVEPFVERIVETELPWWRTRRNWL